MLETENLTAANSRLALLERGEVAYLFSSYRSAISSVLELVEHNSHIVAYIDKSGAAYHIFENVKRRTAGLRFSYLDETNPETILNAFSDDTALIWVESIKAPYLQIPDLEAVSCIAKEKAVISVCDNTLATPYLLQPLKFDFDIVVSDSQSLSAGFNIPQFGYAAVGKDREFLSEKLKFLKNTLGSNANHVGEDFLENAIETYDSRMEIVGANMFELAHFLKLNPNVKDIYLPTFKRGEKAKLAKFFPERNASTLSFRLLGDLESALVLKQKLLTLNNCGEELSPLRKILHPASDLYADVPKEIRSGMEITDDLFQLVVGEGSVKNLIEGLKEAFIQIS